MAANFWASSHCNRWLFSRSQLDKRKEHGRGSFSPEEVQVLNCHLLGLVEKIGEGLKWRQTVIATAKVLYKRFYIQKTLEKFDPRLIMVTSMYLAAKIEEMGQYSLTKLLNQVKAETRPFTLFPRYTGRCFFVSSLIGTKFLLLYIQPNMFTTLSFTFYKQFPLT